MAASVVRHRKLVDGSYSLVVNLDDTRTVDVLNAKGEVVGTQTDESFFREFTFPPLSALSSDKVEHDDGKLVKPNLPSAKDYEAQQLAEVKLLLEDEAARASAGKKLEAEGQAL